MSKYQLPFNSDELDKIINNASAEQLAWMSGYLWGIVAKGALQVESSTLPQNQVDNDLSAANSQKVITLVSASQTGNARRVASELSRDFERLGLVFNHVHAADYKFKKIDQDDIVIIITSTQGEGEVPEEALPFYKFLFSKKAPQLPNLNYAVLGLGDSSYVHFCKAGKDFDQRLMQLGAKRLADRVDLDTDYQQISANWRQTIVDRLAQSIKQSGDPSKALTNNRNIIVENSQYNRENPFMAMVNVNQKITASHSDRDIRHIELDLSDSGILYQAGDTLGVWYENSPALVEELLSLMPFDSEVDVELHGERYRLKQVLIEKIELTQNTPVIISKYAQLIANSQLLALISDKTALRDFAQTTPIIDMISRYQGEFSAQALIDILRPLTPRLYSIASAQDEVGDEAHLTVNVVQYLIDDKKRTGGASYFLAEQIPEQSQIKVFIEPNDNFRLPSDNGLPIIMIAAGSGIAPFRAFMQQRASEAASGENWLLFGNPHFTADFLYQIEWQSYLKDGVLSRIDLAWSRDQAQKVYVQDKLLAQGVDIWQWLQRGAYLYVCGDANNMAKAVNTVLLQIIMQQGQYNEEQANNYLDELRSNKRYQRDIY
ncbi:assimilatory sulfite reductase (NADPH) flavoprotein subunit [Orbus wheelerorum]|uniref:assimilatory sulfite reductase (NADPH) flavoprotein subunit n=1 Tax=Orbus wheelerorum TaxID=3074111 RepID=UPI00370D387D